jgi:hypothetical protein
MELKVGQSLKYNGSSKISKIAKIEGETVYFTDNSRAGLDLVRKSYSEPSISELINENVGNNNNHNINHNQNNQNTMQNNQPQNQYQQPPQVNETVQPTSFGQNSLSGLVDQINSFSQTGQVQQGGVAIGDTGGGNIPTSQPFNPNNNAPNNVVQPNNNAPINNAMPGLPDISGLSPETQRKVMEDYQNQLKTAQNPQPVPHDPFFDQFDNSGEVKEEVRRVSAEENAQKLADVRSYNNGDMSDEDFNKIQKSSEPSKVYRHNPKLPKMRKTKAIKINLIINEMIPKLEDIRAVDSLFDDVSIIEELGKEIASKYLNDPEMLENLIIADLEKKVKSTRKRTPAKKTPAKKTVAKKPAAKKAPVKKTTTK